MGGRAVQDPCAHGGSHRTNFVRGGFHFWDRGFFASGAFDSHVWMRFETSQSATGRRFGRESALGRIPYFSNRILNGRWVGKRKTGEAL